MHFKISSAICFSLDQSKILSSGNGLSNILFVAYNSLHFGLVYNVSIGNSFVMKKPTPHHQIGASLHHF